MVEGEPALPFIQMLQGAQRRKQRNGMLRFSARLSAPLNASLGRALERVEARMDSEGGANGIPGQKLTTEQRRYDAFMILLSEAADAVEEYWHTLES
jgi:hypothetical protein